MCARIISLVYRVLYSLDKMTECTDQRYSTPAVADHFGSLSISY